MRILLIAPPGAGQMEPCMALAEGLLGRGHEVTWAMAPVALDRLNARGFSCFAAGSENLDFQNRELYFPDHKLLRGWDEFVATATKIILPSTGQIVRDVLRRADRQSYDLILSDISSPAGRILGELWGTAWISICTTSLSEATPGIPPYGFEDELEQGRSLEEYREGHRAIREDFNQLRRSLGLPPVLHGWNDFFSKLLTLVVTSPELEYGRARLPRRLAFVGALFSALPGRPLDPDLDAWLTRYENRGVLYASLGTVFNRYGTLMKDLIEGAVLSGRPTLIATGSPSPGEMGTLPKRVRVVPWVNQEAVLIRARGVLCHGGMSTCNGAIRHGLPLVTIPVGCDQPSLSRKLEALGCAIRIQPSHATPAVIAAAVESLFRGVQNANMGRLRSSYERLGGLAAAVQHIESLRFFAAPSQLTISSGNVQL